MLRAHVHGRSARMSSLVAWEVNSMGREAEYKKQLEAMGIYEPAFDPAIHDLCILERQASRTRKEWKEAETAAGKKSPSVTHPLYSEIAKLEDIIAARRDALGLTPRGLRRLKKTAAEDPERQKNEITQRLDAILARCKAYDE